MLNLLKHLWYSIHRHFYITKKDFVFKRYRESFLYRKTAIYHFHNNYSIRVHELIREVSGKKYKVLVFPKSNQFIFYYENKLVDDDELDRIIYEYQLKKPIY